jgi:hypothetical protein
MIGVPRRARSLALLLGVLALTAVLAVWLGGDPARRAVGRTTANVAGGLNSVAARLDPQPSPAPGAAVTPEPVVTIGTTTPAEPAEPKQVAPPPAPRVERFELIVPTGAVPGQVELAWRVSGEGSPAVRIWKMNGARREPLEPGPLPLEGTRTVPIAEPMEQFDLEASNGGAPVVKSVGLMMMQPPGIVDFRAEPAEIAPGGAATLVWQVRGASRAAIGDQAVDPRGGRLEVRPTADTEFTLTLQNDHGNASRTVSVRVLAPAEASSPSGA